MYKTTILYGRGFALSHDNEGYARPGREFVMEAAFSHDLMCVERGKTFPVEVGLIEKV
jgi:hypothetical protein